MLSREFLQVRTDALPACRKNGSNASKVKTLRRWAGKDKIAAAELRTTVDDRPMKRRTHGDVARNAHRTAESFIMALGISHLSKQA
jgi:hypothetical protein